MRVCEKGRGPGDGAHEKGQSPLRPRRARRTHLSDDRTLPVSFFCEEWQFDHDEMGGSGDRPPGAFEIGEARLARSYSFRGTGGESMRGRETMNRKDEGYLHEMALVSGRTERHWLRPRVLRSVRGMLAARHRALRRSPGQTAFQRSGVVPPVLPVLSALAGRDGRLPWPYTHPRW
jgi:hypothetical protein